jgi:hypothetical protein
MRPDSVKSYYFFKMYLMKEITLTSQPLLILVEITLSVKMTL